MSGLLYARAQMGMSLAFHIVFAAAGVALPVLMVIADVWHRRTGDVELRRLGDKLAKGTAILFAVGAVSGTVLSFELGLLWPRFMAEYGQVIGLPFALEGFAFFTEAIFLGIYLYGRERVSPRVHLFAGVLVALSGAASAFFVVLVNAFMNEPGGFHVVNGVVTDVEPWRAMFSGAWPTQTTHVLVSCYEATAVAMAGIHATMLLRHPTSTFHRKALAVALPLAIVSALVQPLVGDRSAKHDAVAQPEKLAAMEGLFTTEAAAPLELGGWADEQAREMHGSIAIPYGLSLLAFDGPHARVTGLDAFPRDTWPPVTKVHLAFDVMVATGSALALLALVTVIAWWRLDAWPGWLLRAWVCAGPLGLVALEAGWLVTEYGRQPWVVHGTLRTADALTPVHPLGPPFFVFTLVYLGLGAMVATLLWRQVTSTGLGKLDEDAHG